MRFGSDQLRDKALLALEEAVVECRYGAPRRTFAIRFALAYLWACSQADRQPFEDFWVALGHDKSPWSFGVADGALLAIYRAVGVKRDGKAAMTIWEKRHREER